MSRSVWVLCFVLALPPSAFALPILASTEFESAVNRPEMILPEPAALVLTGLGLTLVAWRARRRRAQ
jgi:hypothetical protein